MNDTIAAIATPLAQGAISIIRVSGSDAVTIVQSIFDRDLKHQKANTITYGFIVEPNSGNRVDEVLVSLFRAPHSFSGEDVVEINCHGGVYITKEVLALVLGAGARLAHPGEFSQRAFLNGRIDLTQAEAIMDLISAKDQVNAQQALSGIRGSVRQLLEPLTTQILDIIANIEVNIDYPEYEDALTLTNDIILPKIETWLKQLDMILERSQSGRIVKNGIQTAIIGRPNVGKSSLLNALLEEEKAIVSDEEGTTRDLVEGSIQLRGITLNLIDTAGIRESDSHVERIGIERSKQMIQAAQLILLVVDATSPLTKTDHELLEMVQDKPHCIVYNKADQIDTHPKGIAVSALHHELDELMDALQELYETHALIAQQPLLQNERQIGLFIQAKTNMEHAVQALREGIQMDLAELDIQAAYQNLKEILGEYHRDDLLDALFANFCLGK